MPSCTFIRAAVLARKDGRLKLFSQKETRTNGSRFSQKTSGTNIQTLLHPTNPEARSPDGKTRAIYQVVRNQDLAKESASSYRQTATISVVSEKKRYPENAPGPFYVEADLCILCGTPAAVSPDLVEMNEKHCYFRKQPSTGVELAHAIKAVNSCCCGAYRYGGDDRDVIARLDAEACDKA